MKRVNFLSTILVVASAFIGLTANVSAASPERALPVLHQAVIAGDLRQVKQLVANGADINQLDPKMGNSPLHIAAQTEHTHILKFLLSEGAFINLQAPRSGFTPLMIAAWYSKANNIKALLSHPEINIELKTPSGAKAEDWVGGWDKDIQPHEAKRNIELATLFATKRRQQEALLQSQRILNTVESTVLDEETKLEVIKQLIANGADVNQRRPVYSSRNDWHTPLLVSAREGYIHIVDLLLQHGADQTIPGYPMNAIAFHKAGYMGHPRIVKRLLNDERAALVLNAQGPNNGYTPLHDAIWHGHYSAAKAFIDGGALLDLSTYEQETPEQLAQKYQYQMIVRLLQKKRSETNAK